MKTEHPPSAWHLPVGSELTSHHEYDQSKFQVAVSKVFFLLLLLFAEIVNFTRCDPSVLILLLYALKMPVGLVKN